MGTKLAISRPDSSIPQCASPQLMPFHIAHSGPSPISTFFRIKTLESDQSSASANNTEIVSELKGSPNLSLKKRLQAAFRGRQVIGTRIDLPEGFSGYVLRSDSLDPNTPAYKAKMNKVLEEEQDTRIKKARAAKSKSKTTGKPPSRRSTRRTKASTPEAEESEEKQQAMDVDSLDSPDPSPVDLSTLGPDTHEKTRVFKPTQMFDSLIIWNSDFAVDEGRDEYIRSLREWTTISAELHRPEV